MSDRLTNQWTATLEEAFGEMGKKGREGEEFLFEVFDKWGWEYKDTESNKTEQLNGIDVWFKKPEWSKFYSANVKNNITPAGNFRVYEDWFDGLLMFDRIFHVNDQTKNLCWYDAQHMKNSFTHINPSEKFVDGNMKTFVSFNLKHLPSHIKKAFIK